MIRMRDLATATGKPDPFSGLTITRAATFSACTGACTYPAHHPSTIAPRMSVAFSAISVI